MPFKTLARRATTNTASNVTGQEQIRTHMNVAAGLDQGHREVSLVANRRRQSGGKQGSAVLIAKDRPDWPRHPRAPVRSRASVQASSNRQSPPQEGDLPATAASVRVVRPLVFLIHDWEGRGTLIPAYWPGNFIQPSLQRLVDLTSSAWPGRMRKSVPWQTSIGQIFALRPRHFAFIGPIPILYPRRCSVGIPSTSG